MLRDEGHRSHISYSRKVFIPLTRLCRDVCHYCTFAQPPRKGHRAFLTPAEVLDIARAGAAAGCHEALFTLGDKPELRYRVAREELAALGHGTTLSYLTAMCRLVLEETGLLPHANPGLMTAEEIAALREVTVSQGIMLESSAERLCQRGGPHHGSPDKIPARRLKTIALAGEQAVPFTTGILIGIGETRAERLDSLLAIRELHDRHGHIQEIIVQNFRSKPGTRMMAAAEPDIDDLKWTIALARILFGPAMNIQAPPNLTEHFGSLVEAGLNDWGGVSPVTPDHVNPEAAWPQIAVLARETEKAGKQLVQRLAVYPPYALEAGHWQAPAVRPALLRAMDSGGLARDHNWSPGVTLVQPPRRAPALGLLDPRIGRGIALAARNEPLDAMMIETLFGARGVDLEAICEAADGIRSERSGDVVRYVVNRNINYTNVCSFKCGFCAFSKGKTSEALRGAPYDLALDEISRRTVEAWERGASEVCMQGGIHPAYNGDTYRTLCRTVKQAEPEMHIHAFSPLEIAHGASSLGLSIGDYLASLKEAGLGTLPGTAAEVLDDEVRAVICPDKLTTAQWLDIVGTAHEVGLRTTSTIMFGHVDRPRHWARHLIVLRDLQARTGGITEFVPLPFVHMEAPIYLKGRARRGPTWRETLLMHAVARLALNPLITNIQASWVKIGPAGVGALLNAGVNDLGGTLMNESISRAAGTGHGQEMPPEAMEQLIRAHGRIPIQRTTLYRDADPTQRARSYAAQALSQVVQTPVARRWPATAA
ncbi:5-amino-6-(D-ribitylamino)uracil--L-tyrosine 4-hydroxyphenyl transferase CofH [Sphingobium sp. JS3065]|nr:5-amino-6-(D-ribitylamino)uracil--L-tyrosine 4-hydroxyphenyl transferase CofH [Sphingobium sp. JS3065]UZW57803.1 5-amino-6-(D-ribitylamino)uracil--L-tyrosine 4-hydroxyphenyl transferase CofH [Sphingobium sp. JS3065]